MTESHGSERRALNAERQLQLLSDSVRDYAIFMLDHDGRVATWNLGAQLIKGYEAHEIVGQSIHAFYTPEDRAAHRPDLLLAEARASGRVEDEGWRVRKDGTRFWADVVITALHEADGELVGFVKVTRDLTDRRDAETARLRLAHTEEALRLRDEFLSIAAHELRTPLVALQLQVDSLREQGAALDAKQLSKVNRASRNIQRMTDLIAALLDVSRISRGHLKLMPKRIDLGELVREVIDRLDEPAREAKCEVVPVLASGVVGVWDPLRIGQVVSNLLANSFKYASGSRIDVRLGRDGDTAIVSVEDRGPGIPADRLDRVFERFERAAPSKNYGGLGLGLYVAREIVVAHDGKITARNRDGGGAAVDIRLPIRDTPPAEQGPS